MILGGAQENTLLTCEELHKRGHEVILITGPALGPEGQLMDRARQGGYKVIELKQMRRAINPVRDIICYRQLKKILAQLKPDIVHTHSAKAGILGRWAAAKVRDKAADACCRRVEKLRQAQSARGKQPLIVHTIHGLAFHPYQSGLLNRFYISIEKAAASRTDAFISVAQAMTNQTLAAGIGQPEQFTKVFSGLETKNFLEQPTADKIAALRNKYNIPAETVVITTVARLFKLKGHEYIIESAKEIARKHKNVMWLFIGDGKLREPLEQVIARLGLQDRFRFTGLIAPERIGELLHAGDILVHCSLREGLARAIPQALLCGKPVVSFDVDGAREVVLNNRTGYLVRPRDVSTLSAALEKLIADPELCRQLGETGRKLCSQEFDYKTMTDRIELVYRQFGGSKNIN